MTTDPQLAGYRRLVADLIAAAESHTPPRPGLPAASREQVVRLLGQLLIRDDLLEGYRAVLKPELLHRAELLAAIRAGRDEFPVEEVVRDGLEVLTDEQVARLALDETELETLCEYLSELLETAGCGGVWYDLMVGDSPDPVPYKGAPETRPSDPPPPLFILQARPYRCEKTGATLWPLTSGSDGRSPRLPSHLARLCYGVSDQEVAMSLVREPVEPGLWAVNLRIKPAPLVTGLVIVTTFSDGSRVRFTIPPHPTLGPGQARERHVLPDAAFGTDGWMQVARFEPQPTPSVLQ